MSIKRNFPIISLAAAAMIVAPISTVTRAQTSGGTDQPATATLSPAAPESDGKTRDAVSPDHPNYTLGDRLAFIQKSTQLSGMTVHDRADHKLGKIEDLVLDLHTGRVLCTVVAPTGIYGGQFHVLIPGGCFYAANQDRALLSIEKPNLNDAPRITGPLPAAAALAKPLADACAYFNQKNPWNGPTAPSEFVKCSQLVGLPEVNTAGENLGRVINLMIDLPSSHVFYVIASVDDAGRQLYALPPAMLIVASEKKQVTLAVTRTKINEAAEPNTFFWTDLTDPTWATATYRRYGLDPDLSGDGVPASDSTRENVRARIDEKPAATDTGGTASPDDSAMTKNILTAFVRDDMGNAWAHQGVKISTVNGHVVLSGVVKTEKQKDRFGELAEGVAGAGNVDNELQTRK